MIREMYRFLIANFLGFNSFPNGQRVKRGKRGKRRQGDHALIDTVHYSQYTQDMYCMLLRMFDVYVAKTCVGETVAERTEQDGRFSLCVVYESE